MRNGLMDLHNYLFEQIERLNDDELTGEALQEQVCKSRQITDIGKVIVQNASLMLKARKLIDDGSMDRKDVPQILIGEKE